MRVLTKSQHYLKLDANDKKILLELRQNIRQPFTKVADKCHLSRQIVDYRIQKMQEQELIIGSRTVINIKKLGYKSYHVFIEAHTPHEEKELISRAEKADFVNAIILYSGKYNIEISIMARNEVEFLSYYTQLVDKIRIRNDQILTILETVVARVLPDKFLELKSKPEKNFTEEKPKPVKKKKADKELDKTDLELLQALSQNATKSVLALAKELNLSKDTVKYRIQQLEKENYIVEYRPVINFSALGISINAVLIKLNHNEQEIKLFETFLKSEESVLWAVKTFGYFDYLVYVMGRNLDEFHEVINRLKQKFEGIIKTYDVVFAYYEVKYDFMAKNIVKGYLEKR